MANPTLDIRLERPGLRLEDVDVTVLADFLKDFDKAVEGESGSADAATPTLALIDIYRGSAGYKCYVADRATEGAARVIEGLVNRGFAWRRLSEKSQAATIRGLTTLVKSGVAVTLDAGWRSGLRFTATTAADIPKPDRSLVLRGGTTRRLEIIRVGNLFKPSAKGKMAGDLEVTIYGSKPLMQQLGERLYREVLVTGVGTWDLESDTLVEIDAKEVNDPPEGDFDDAMRKLAAIKTAPWATMTGEEFLKFHRHEGDK